MVTNYKNDYVADNTKTFKEKIRSGVQFFYREGGSTIFELRMKEVIQDTILEKALNKTYLRYPYFTYQVVGQNGDFYLEDNPLPIIPKKTKQLYSLGSAEINYHIFDVTYSDKSIYLSLHHGFCDGLGIMAFSKTLLYYYCMYRYNHTFEMPDVRLVGEPLLYGEMAEPFNSASPPAADEGAKVFSLNADGYVLPECLAGTDNKKGYRFEISIAHAKFMEIAKLNNATPAILISLLMAKSVKNIHPNTEKPITCILAIDMRKGINLENTYKNCTTTITLPYDTEFEKRPLRDQATIFREKIKECKTVDFISREVDNYNYTYNTLDKLKTYEEKRNLFSSFDNIVTNTFIVSYIGQSKLGDCEKFVDSIHSYGSGGAGITIEIFAVGDYFTLDFMQSFESDLYINSLARVMDNMGLEFTISDSIEFETPVSSVQMSEPKA